MDNSTLAGYTLLTFVVFGPILVGLLVCFYILYDCLKEI